MSSLQDGCGRLLRALRVSVTDRCNLRCQYCMPAQGTPFCAAPDLLSFDDIVRVVRVSASLGIDRIRLTGGEPLLRPRLGELIARLKAETAVAEIAMTTNGMLLARHVPELRAAGLDRLTVSVDSLDPDRFRAVTRFGDLDDVWDGIRAAAAAGLRPIKINVVVLKGMNDDEVVRWMELTRTQDLVVRFLEVMPMGPCSSDMSAHVDLTALRERVGPPLGLRRVEGPVGNGPARYWQLPDAAGTIGFITPLSERYCDTCSRFRLTAQGGLRPCLSDDFEVSLLPALRAPSDDALVEAFRTAAAGKSPGHAWSRQAGAEGGNLTQMSRLGG